MTEARATMRIGIDLGSRKAKFALLELFKSGLRLSPARRGHLKACLLAPLVGLARRHFGYFLVSATKR